MYQVSNNISFRLNDEQRTELNALALELQTVEDTVFSNARELVFSLINQNIQLKNKCLQLELNVNSEVNTDIQEVNTEVNTDIQEAHTEVNAEIQEPNTESTLSQREQIILQIGYETNPTDEELFTDLLEIINTDLTDQLPTERTEVVIKEVEKPLAKTEILISLSEKDLYIIERIARFRVSRKLDKTRLKNSSVIYNLAFNLGSLTNFSGLFETGFTSKRLKK